MLRYLAVARQVLVGLRGNVQIGEHPNLIGGDPGDAQRVHHGEGAHAATDAHKRHVNQRNPEIKKLLIRPDRGL